MVPLAWLCSTHVECTCGACGRGFHILLYTHAVGTSPMCSCSPLCNPTLLPPPLPNALPSVCRRRNPAANWVLADFGAWADFVKLRDLNTCLAIGEISGVLGQIRKFAMSSSQVVLLLAAQNLAGNPVQSRYCPQPDGLPPATVRYMTFNYMDTNDEVVREATDLFKQISDLTSNWVRSGVGPSTGPGLVTLPGVGFNEENTATFGSYRWVSGAEQQAGVWEVG